MDPRWIDQLFVEHGGWYAEQLAALIPQAQGEADWIAKVLNEHGLKPDGRVLDLCCGVGRHSLALARLGHEVVGVDLSPAHLERARRLAGEVGASDRVRFLQGDMRDIGRLLDGERFDAVLNLFTSFGFYDEATDVGVLAQCRALTRPGGLFLIDTANRDWLVRHFQPKGFNRLGRHLLLEEREMAPRAHRMHNVWTLLEEVETGTFKTLDVIALRHRVYDLATLCAQFEAAGWRYAEAFGGLDGAPFELGARRVVGVFENPAG